MVAEMVRFSKPASVKTLPADTNRSSGLLMCNPEASASSLPVSQLLQAARALVHFLLFPGGEGLTSPRPTS